MNVNELNTTPYRKLLAVFLFSVFSTTMSFGQCPNMAEVCNDVINVFLTNTCMATITPDDVFEGDVDEACYSVALFLPDGTPLAPADEVDGTHIGIALSVVITNVFTGSTFCDGPNGTVVNVIDNVNPVLSGCEAVTVTCGDDTRPVSEGGIIPDPTVTDCDPNLLSYIDAFGGFTDCPAEPVDTLFRTWTATDGSGNVDTCIQAIIINRILDPMDIVFPGNINLDCPSPNTNPSVTGFPQSNGVNITSSSNVCELQSSFIDLPLPFQCDGQSQIIRSWTVYNCTGTFATGDQVIFIIDDVAPTLVCPPNITISTGQDDCIASTTLVAPTVSDVCSSVEFLTSVSGGTLIGMELSDLEVGEIYTVTHMAQDDCGNMSPACSYTITVEDQVNPTAVCDQITISISGNPTNVPAGNFNNMSFDNCEIVSVLARRMDSSSCPGDDETDFGPTVPFFCCDVDNTVMVALRVEDASGNINICMVEIDVDDKIDPEVECPDDITIDCMESTNPTNTGQATASDNCNFTLTSRDETDLNSCGVGEIVRWWIVTDASGNKDSCDQIITIENETPFDGDNITWPQQNISLSSCNAATDLSVTGIPTFNEDACDQVDTLLHVDTRLEIGGCVVILRKWTVFDNCQDADAGDECHVDLNVADIASWCFTQTISVFESEPPVINSSCDDRNFPGNPANCENGTVELILDATDDCNPGDLTYLWEIDINNDDNDNPEFTGTDNDASGTYVYGTHHIYWKAEDKCGNLTECEYLFTIADSTAPYLTTFNIISGELDPANSIIQWASDWVVAGSSGDNCGIIEYLVNVPSLGAGQDFPPITAETSYEFTCTDKTTIGDTITVDVWVRDANFNWTYTTPNIVLQDNQAPYCSSPNHAVVAGGILNEEGDEVEHVMVKASGNGMEEGQMTGNTGTFSFSLPMDQNYSVTPERDDNILNGVSTLDLVKINKHILQTETLSSPYKLIAADVNHSGAVSAIDMVELRKVILFIETEFPDNTSWRFVDATFVFPDPTNPFASTFPEVYTVNGLIADEVADFVAIKVGDVNCSASPNDLAGNGEDRNSETLQFVVEDQQLTIGETYTVDFNAAEFEAIEGFQFTLNFDAEALELDAINAAKLNNLNDGNFGTHMLNEGVITTSWNVFGSAETLQDGDAVFSMTFTAKANGQLRDLISISSRYTKAEAYGQNGVSDLNVIFSTENGALAGNQFELFQNRPNPFKNETVIGFNLLEAGKAALTIFDISGRTLQMIEGDFTKGYNEISLNRRDLNSTGVLYYQLESANSIASMKMVLMD